MSESAKL